MWQGRVDPSSVPLKMKRHQGKLRDAVARSLGPALSHIEVLWLFTYSDMKTIMFPQSILGTATAYAACVLGQPHTIEDAPRLICYHYPAALLWVWANLLPFNILNQISEDAVAEDAINKPWRPFPSGKVSRRRAGVIMLGHYALAVITSLMLGGLRQCLLLIALGTWYNVGGGADVSFIIRNSINAMGILSFACGAMEVALGAQLSANSVSLRWVSLLASVIFSTIQTQDLYDKKGDSMRDRKTMPLVAGDAPTRWFTAIAVATWSLAGPAYWNLTARAAATPLLGLIIAYRTMKHRSVEADKTTFRYWNVWLVSLYALPLIRYLGVGCV